MIRQLVTASAVLALATATARAQTSEPAPRPSTPHGFAFPDTLGAGFNVADTSTAAGTPADFDFLVGMWEFSFRQRRLDGTYNAPFSGHWSATRKASPNAFVEDHFRANRPSVPMDEGTWTYRVFNPQRKLWTMEGVSSETGAWAPGLCWSDASNRYAIQHYGRSLARIRYFAITDTSFMWRTDMSYDGGKTWRLDWWTAEAHRIGR